ncbi:flavodoxin family protein [Youngiibacter multivorans]|uniref:Flavodoxin n=1 Tax=Youngiibacter multivorans TaxID=937251 RepID=A0ABS4G236_9CLOT|nr:flavodoxin family protein [Youngiibacter multivorans]MBP1918611.1 flavodoxin [Youngiibacter multivorans]
MNIGILVHSKTGNTLSVVKLLEDRLRKNGHTVSIERIVPDNEDQPDKSKIKLVSAPSASGFDSVVLAGPVHGFSPTAAIVRWIEGSDDLNGKNIPLVITQQLPFPWMGGNGTVRKITALLEKKGAKVPVTSIVNWGSGKRQMLIDDTVNKVSEYLK